MPTTADATVRDGLKAVTFAEKAVAATSRTNAVYLATLAAAHAENGGFTNAVRIQGEALALLRSDSEKRNFATRLKLYQADTAYHEPRQK